MTTMYTGLRRTLILSAAVTALFGAAGGLAAATPTLTADGREEGTVAVSSDPAQESWRCLLAGAAVEAGFRVDMATTGESRGGFAPASTVGAVCMSITDPNIAVITGVSSLDDDD